MLISFAHFVSFVCLKYLSLCLRFSFSPKWALKRFFFFFKYFIIPCRVLFSLIHCFWSIYFYIMRLTIHWISFYPPASVASVLKWNLHFPTAYSFVWHSVTKAGNNGRSEFTAARNFFTNHRTSCYSRRSMSTYRKIEHSWISSSSVTCVFVTNISITGVDFNV